MKLAKLSLVAVLTAGAFTTLSATALEEAIKGVDISGMLRIRSDYDSYKDNVTGDKFNNGANYRFQGVATLSVPVAENLKSVISARYNTNSTNDNYTENGFGDGSASDRNVVISRAYFQLSIDNFIFKAGKMEIGSPWTDNNVLDGQSGNGLFLAYTGVENWTFAVANFFNTFNGYGNHNGAAPDILGNTTLGFGNSNLTAIGVIGSVGPVNARLWASKLEHVFKHAIFFELSAKYWGFTARAQVNNLKLTDEVKNTLFGVNYGKDSGTFWGAELGYNYDFFGINAGYTKNGKQGVYSLENDNDFIQAGKLLHMTYNNMPDAKTWFITANAKFEKYSVGAGYVQSKASAQTYGAGSYMENFGELKGKEWYIEAGYAYSKNFQIYAFYSDVSFSSGNSGALRHVEVANDIDTDNSVKKRQRARIEAIYKF